MRGENDNMIAFSAYWKSMETDFLLDLHEIITSFFLCCWTFTVCWWQLLDNQISSEFTGPATFQLQSMVARYDQDLKNERFWVQAS